VPDPTFAALSGRRDRLLSTLSYFAAHLTEAEDLVRDAAAACAVAGEMLDSALAACSLPTPNVADPAVAQACRTSDAALQTQRHVDGSIAALRARVCELEELLAKEMP
jgi:hypothetical protein